MHLFMELKKAVRVFVQAQVHLTLDAHEHRLSSALWHFASLPLFNYHWPVPNLTLSYVCIWNRFCKALSLLLFKVTLN